MGTHAIVRFVSSKKRKPLVCYYFQYDGYLRGVGLNLARFLESRKIVNGIPSGREEPGVIYANGIGCLAAQYCSQFKTEPGGFYIVDDDEHEYFTYTVIVDDDSNLQPHQLIDIHIHYSVTDKIMTLDKFKKLAERKNLSEKHT